MTTNFETPNAQTPNALTVENFNAPTVAYDSFDCDDTGLSPINGIECKFDNGAISKAARKS
jgi:hypothetical protein